MGCGASTSNPSDQATSIVPAAPAAAEDPAPTPTQLPTPATSLETPSSPVTQKEVTQPGQEVSSSSSSSSASPPLIGVQKAAKPPEDGSREKLEDRAAKRAEERESMKKQMQKDRSRFKEGLPTSPIGNDSRRASEIATFGGSEGRKEEHPTTEASSDPSQSDSVVSKEEGMNVTDYS